MIPFNYRHHLFYLVNYKHKLRPGHIFLHPWSTLWLSKFYCFHLIYAFILLFTQINNHFLWPSLYPQHLVESKTRFSWIDLRPPPLIKVFPCPIHLSRKASLGLELRVGLLRNNHSCLSQANLQGAFIPICANWHFALKGCTFNAWNCTAFHLQHFPLTLIVRASSWPQRTYEHFFFSSYFKPHFFRGCLPCCTAVLEGKHSFLQIALFIST